MKNTATKKKTIDAKFRRLGRVATEAAMLLMGKTSATYRRNQVNAPGVVEIVNASQLSIDGRKLKDKIYQRYSGYPGGLKEETMGHLIDRKGHASIVRKAVEGMLPHNRLKKVMLKRLVIKE